MRKSRIKETIMINPKSHVDIDDIRRTLQSKEVSILVNMSNSKDKVDYELVNASIDYILSGARYYMTINVKKIFPEAFICYSKRQKV